MSITPLNTICAVKILSIKNTKGSSPFQVLCDDGEIYFAKTTDSQTEPLSELICEVIGNYYASIWGLKVPAPCLIKINQEIVDAFLAETNSALPERYNKTKFNHILFFGVKSIVNIIEIDRYMNGLSGKKEFNYFNSPLDLVKIGVLDFWLGNKDRKPNNPNILLASNSGKFNFVPIDHAACFGYSKNYKSLTISQLHVEDGSNMLSSGLSKSILKHSQNSELLNLISSINDCMIASIENSSDVFNQIPSEWGFSKKAKDNVIFVLSNQKRNKDITSIFTRFIPKK